MDCIYIYANEDMRGMASALRVIIQRYIYIYIKCDVHAEPLGAPLTQIRATHHPRTSRIICPTSLSAHRSLCEQHADYLRAELENSFHFHSFTTTMMAKTKHTRDDSRAELYISFGGPNDLGGVFQGFVGGLCASAREEGFVG